MNKIKGLIKDIGGKFKALSKPKRVAYLLTLIGAAAATAAFYTAAQCSGYEGQILNLARENGYEEANDQYIESQVNNLHSQFENGQITLNEYILNTNQMQDLSVDEYMMSDNASPQLTEQYTTLKNEANTYAQATVGLFCSTAACGLGTVALGLIFRDSGIFEMPSRKSRLLEND